ncbi:MAG: HIT domain-containing protein [Deltaproteobacteria bacterium]|nr:HIT domain-containing protein [Deltaproteobacteria bacterium]
MERIFAPWRGEYIRGSINESGCIFCEKPSEKKDRENLILYSDELVFVIMNKFPYNSGHLMVVPLKHTADMAELTDDEMVRLFRLTDFSIRILRDKYKAQGINIGMNLGRVAGAGVDQHLHIHIVPRYNGDTNFMPLLSETKIISEHLERTYDELLPEFNKLKKGK